MGQDILFAIKKGELETNKNGCELK